MNIKSMIVSLALGMGLSNVARAENPVVQQDTSRVEQDKGNIQTDKDQLAKIDEAIKQDKASHNVDQLKKDRALRREMVRNRKQDKHRLNKDSKEVTTDGKAQ